MAKTIFFIFFLCLEYEKNKFAMFSVSLYAFCDLLCYRWLKICYKEPCELMFIYIVWFNMLYIRFIRIIWKYRAFSHLCNKMATKINYALDHHEFVCQRIWINHPADSQTDSLLYKPSVQLSVCNKRQKLSTLLYLP